MVVSINCKQLNCNSRTENAWTFSPTRHIFETNWAILLHMSHTVSDPGFPARGGNLSQSSIFYLFSLSLPPSIPMAFIQASAQEPLKLSLLCMLLSMDFGSCFTFDLKFKPKYCFKKILYPENLHFLVLFLFKHNLKCAWMTQNRYLKGSYLLKLWQSCNGML